MWMSRLGASRVTLRDVAKMGALLGFVRFAHPSRLERYEGVTWEALIADLSDEAKVWASNLLGTFTGMDTITVRMQESNGEKKLIFDPSISAPAGAEQLVQAGK